MRRPLRYGFALGGAFPPDGRQLIAGAVDGGYLVDAAARSAVPLRLEQAGGGPNCSTVVIPLASVPGG